MVGRDTISPFVDEEQPEAVAVDADGNVVIQGEAGDVEYAEDAEYAEETGDAGDAEEVASQEEGDVLTTEVNEAQD